MSVFAGKKAGMSTQSRWCFAGREGVRNCHCGSLTLYQILQQRAKVTHQVQSLAPWRIGQSTLDHICSISSLNFDFEEGRSWAMVTMIVAHRAFKQTRTKASSSELMVTSSMQWHCSHQHEAINGGVDFRFKILTQMRTCSAQNPDKKGMKRQKILFLWYVQEQLPQFKLLFRDDWWWHVPQQYLKGHWKFFRLSCLISGECRKGALRQWQWNCFA